MVVMENFVTSRVIESINRMGGVRSELPSEKKSHGAEKRKQGAKKRKQGAEKRNCTLGPP